MATGFHESTVAISVRNFLVIHGKATIPLITERLQKLWLAEVDEDEVKVALKGLVARKLAKKLKAGFFESSTATLVQQRDRPGFAEKDREAAAWEGWRFRKQGDAPGGFQLDRDQLPKGWR
jgi:hypothetical protein